MSQQEIIPPTPSAQYQYRPSPASLAFRAQMADLIHPFRRVRPRVPFWKLAAHRLPTLWVLYRGLLFNAPSPEIGWRVRTLFRKHRYIVNASGAAEQLKTGHRWLDIFIRAREGDEHWRKVLDRYTSLISVNRQKERTKSLILQELDEQRKLTERKPMMTGSYLEPTMFNKPLPRLRPQPLHISMMIFKRRMARQRRLALFDEVKEWRTHIAAEVAMEVQLMKGAPARKFVPVFKGQGEAWDAPLRAKLRGLQDTFDRDHARVRTPFPPELLAAIKEARAHKHAFRTEQRDLERRGLITPALARRMRQRPPAHRLVKMSPQQKRVDRILRGASEGGYAGMVKRRAGVRMKKSFEEWQRAEEGEPEMREKLGEVARTLRREMWERRHPELVAKGGIPPHSSLDLAEELLEESKANKEG